MQATRWRRRDFLLTTALGVPALGALALAGGPVLAAPAETAGRLDPEATRTLQRMARLLYPHAAIPDAVYAEVVDGAIAAADPPTLALLTDGAASLSKAGPGAWLRAGEPEQIAALKRIESTPFFAALQAGVRERLYAHPAMWAHLDYPGPSLPFGGYVDKGFDDIDWLPKSASKNG